MSAVSIQRMLLTWGGMFRGCKKLTSLDISGFNTENVTNMWNMFSGCENIKTIYVGDRWNTNSLSIGYGWIGSVGLFENCPNLVGEKGTKFNEKHTDVDYAHIDGGESNPGYFTKKTE